MILRETSPLQPYFSRCWILVIAGVHLLGITLLAGCADSSTRPPAPPPSPEVLDFMPAWSHDGESVAFLRADSSSFGPPGLYRMHYPSGAPELLSTLAVDGFRRLQFTSDDSALLASWYGLITKITVGSGQHEHYFVNATTAVFPQMAGDGTRIAYVRPFDEQGTVWIYDLATQKDSIFPAALAPSFGTYPAWGPGDSIIAIAESGGIYLYDFYGEPPRRLTNPLSGELHSVPRWLRRDALLYNVDFNGLREHRILDLSSGATHAIPGGLDDSEALSPAGDSVLFVGQDRNGSTPGRLVIFVRSVEGAPEGARQITSP